MKVIVVGAGIGGSALALGLQRAEIEFVVLEQASALTEIGAGIQLSPNGVRVLDALGLGASLSEFCTEPDGHYYKDWQSGETVLRTPLMPDVREAFGAPYYHAHRADVIGALSQATAPENVRLDTRVVSVGQDADKAWVHCENGEAVTGDVVIGADGLHSLIRDKLFAQDAPRASGYVTWRGVIEAAAVADLEIPVSSYIVMGPRLSFVFYYVSGGRKINWLAMAKAAMKSANPGPRPPPRRKSKRLSKAGTRCRGAWFRPPSSPSSPPSTTASRSSTGSGAGSR